jgi:hypothetical protein
MDLEGAIAAVLYVAHFRQGEQQLLMHLELTREAPVGVKQLVREEEERVQLPLPRATLLHKLSFPQKAS